MRAAVSGFAAAGAARQARLADRRCRSDGGQAAVTGYAAAGAAGPGSLTGDIGLTWFAERATDQADRRDLTLAPFAYLDVEGLRRRAFEIFPFESHWKVRGAWQRLHDGAEKRTEAS
ncbi:MAG TPA: hypothetical protein VL738_29635 [Dactylosporangium sp.]|nr:hypothetical protein [Dactylosporangium sp.]